MNKIKIPNYSLGEEIFNSISHGIFSLVSIYMLILLIIKSFKISRLAVCSCCIYGISLIILYTVSCIYHGLGNNKLKRFMRILDHICVFVLEFGTYVPICLMAFNDRFRYLAFGVVFIITIISIIINLIGVDKYNTLSVILNLLLGWGVVLFYKNLIETMGFYGLLFLILGGVFYSVGVLFYGLGSRIKYMHSIFHIFVILGSIMHFVMVYYYIL